MNLEAHLSRPQDGAASSGLSLRAKGVAVLSIPLLALFVALFAVRWTGTQMNMAEQDIDHEYRRWAATKGLPFDRAEELRLSVMRERHDAARRELSWILVCCGILGPLGALFMHLLVADKLARRLLAVQENARRLAHGLPLDPFPTGTDEIANLARQLEDAAYVMRGREHELRESEGRYRNLFDRAPIPYEETDSEGIVCRFNQELVKLLKTKADRILGCRAWDFVAPDQQEKFKEAMLERLSSARETDPFECDYLLEDGSRITVEIRESLIRRANGEVIGVCRSLLDVTERNLAAIAARKVAQYALELSSKNEQLARALEAARSATEAKSRFLAAVSHELRTPLNGIIGFTEMMFDGKLGKTTDDQKEILGDILTSSRHLLQLINDILDLSKVEAGKMEFRPEPCEIDKLIYEVRDVLRPVAEKKGIEVRTEVPDCLHGMIDRSRFKQVLYNYLSNAVKFTKPGGRVCLRAFLADEGCVRVDVEDTGIGIPPEEIPLLFREFQQLPNSRKAEQGTGLGLALTRHIIEAQGGAVEVHSTPGKGSIFSAILPLNAEESKGSVR